MDANHTREDDQDRAILQVLDANATQFGLEPETIKHLIVRFIGATMDPEAIRHRLYYLADLGLVAQVANENKFHTEIRRYRITAHGTNYLREQGL